MIVGKIFEFPSKPEQPGLSSSICLRTMIESTSTLSSVNKSFVICFFDIVKFLTNCQNMTSNHHPCCVITLKHYVFDRINDVNKFTNLVLRHSPGPGDWGLGPGAWRFEPGA